MGYNPHVLCVGAGVQHADPPTAPHAPQEGLPQCFPDAVGPWWQQELYMSTPCSGG